MTLFDLILGEDIDVYHNKSQFSLFMPEWRKGSRSGLKIRCPQGRVGSNPTSGTTVDINRSQYERTMRPTPLMS